MRCSLPVQAAGPRRRRSVSQRDRSGATRPLRRFHERSHRASSAVSSWSQPSRIGIAAGSAGAARSPGCAGAMGCGEPVPSGAHRGARGASPAGMDPCWAARPAPGGNKRTERTAHRTARSFLESCFTHFWLIFTVAETRWLQGFTYNNRGLQYIFLAIAMVVVAAHTPCRGGGGVELKETSSAQPTAEEGAPHGCPSLRSIRFDTFGVSNLTGYQFLQGGP